MIILKPKYFYHPINYKWEVRRENAENGDYVIEIPSIDFNEEKYASLKEVGRQLHDDEGLLLGNVEITGVRIKCNPKEPLYYGLPPTKSYEYWISLCLNDVAESFFTYELHGTDITFLLRTIIPLINLALKDGYLVSQIDYKWLEWQCNSWESGEANGQGRGFLFKKNDIYSLESLYVYLKSFKLGAISRSIYKRGGGYYWTEIYISFRYIDDYISNLIADALNCKYSKSESDGTICFRIEIDKYEKDGFCTGNDYEIPDDEAQRYRESFEMKIIISAIRAFDLIELKKNRLIKPL